MSNTLVPPLRSALKHPSRPSSPTNFLPEASPAISVSSLPPTSTPTPTPSTTTTNTTDTTTTTTTTTNITASSMTFPTSPLHSAMIHNGVHTHPHPHPHPSHNSIASPHYTPKVSFDTFENPVASMFSFTLQVKSDGYRRTRNTRVFLCASSPDESGSEALDWALESLAQDGDELIVFRGLDEDALDKNHDMLRDEARDLMHTIQSKSVEYDPTRKLSLILEYIPGKVTDSIDRLIALYRPDSLVVGTRGRRFGLVQGLGAGLVQGLGVGAGIGSVSKYCLSHSPVPVIVVRPGRKLRKAVEKRRADPKRGKHFET